MKKYYFLLILTVLFLAGCMSPEKAIEKFTEAVEEKDAEALYQLVYLEDDVYWSEKEADEMIQYFHDNEKMYASQLDLLNAQKEALKEKKALENELGPFYFKDDKKLTARAYELVLDKESFVDFEKLTLSVVEDADVIVEGGSEEDIVIGLFGPGNYKVKAHADYGFVAMDETATVSLVDEAQFKEALSLDLKGEAATVYATEEGVELYINGEKLELDITQKDGVVIQPLLSGLKLQAKVNYPWGELVSEEVAYTGFGSSQINYEGTMFQKNGEIDLTPHIFMNEEEQIEITHIITDFNEKLLRGLTKNDASILKDVAATKEAVTGYDDTFEALEAVKKGELSPSHFPPGVSFLVIGDYDGGLVESVIDFTHATNMKDEKTEEDMLILRVNLVTDFFYRPEGIEIQPNTKDSRNYLKPEIKLKKEDDRWVIAEQLVDLKTRDDKIDLLGEHLVKTKVD